MDELRFDKLVKVTLIGFTVDGEEPAAQNEEPAPDGFPCDVQAAEPGRPWLVQCQTKGRSLRQALRDADWVFEDLVPELLEGMTYGVNGTRALRKLARTLGPEADELPPEGESVCFNVWYTCKESKR